MSRFFLWAAIALASASCLPAQDTRLRPPELPTTPRLGTQQEGMGMPKQVQQQLETFLTNLRKDNPKLAFMKLLENSQFSDQPTVIDSFIDGAEQSQRVFGSMLRYELQNVRPVASRMLVATYITYYQTKIFRWQFLYFTPVGTEWRLVNLKVDDMREFLAPTPNIALPPDKISLMIDKFFVLIQGGKPGEAFENLLRDSPLAENRELGEQFADKTRQAIDTYGAMQSYELYDLSPVGSQHRLLTYFAYLDTEPLRWQFIFDTRDPDQWRLVNVRVDDMLDENLLVN